MPTPRARTIVTLAALAAASGCVTPQALTDLNAQMIEASDAINDVRINLSVLQEQVDSLRLVIAKQDTTISRLANVTGVQVVK